MTAHIGPGLALGPHLTAMLNDNYYITTTATGEITGISPAGRDDNDDYVPLPASPAAMVALAPATTTIPQEAGGKAFTGARGSGGGRRHGHRPGHSTEAQVVERGVYTAWRLDG
jgi:hypothetical protein